MNLCKTCKWWTGRCGEQPFYCKCEHPKIDKVQHDGKGFGVFDGEPFNAGIFATGPNFGCIHHESK